MSVQEIPTAVIVKRLASGWWHIRGNGPCNWAQPPIWPCDEETLRAHAFPQASEKFLKAALHHADTP